MLRARGGGIEPRTLYFQVRDVLHSIRALLIARWSQWFREGRENIKDEARPGRPVTEITSENIEKVRSVINDDSYSTGEELQVQNDLNHGTIQRIIPNHLNLRKITARYIPKHLTDSQRVERV